MPSMTMTAMVRSFNEEAKFRNLAANLRLEILRISINARVAKFGLVVNYFKCMIISRN